MPWLTIWTSEITWARACQAGSAAEILAGPTPWDWAIRRLWSTKKTDPYQSAAVPLKKGSGCKCSFMTSCCICFCSEEEMVTRAAHLAVAGVWKQSMHITVSAQVHVHNAVGMSLQYLWNTTHLKNWAGEGTSALLTIPSSLSPETESSDCCPDVASRWGLPKYRRIWHWSI